ncbi:helix-turn-helix domain-containing protein [Sorangium sp. So ce448]|uniref:AraC family transcriptional regulator n=1 Tax=Sorangium sp. So ce448 TaxID=3133314 RepID=UPI003F62F9D6
MSPSVTPEDPTRGILNPAAGLQRFFELHRHAPAPDLARLVDWHWVVRWSLTAPFEQELLPHPCVNLAIEAPGSAVHGIGTRREVVRLQGTGRVVATKFKPGGFFPFAPLPMRRLVDSVVPLAEIFGGAAGPLERAVLDQPDDAVAIRAVEELLRARKGPEDAGLDEAMALAVRAQGDRDIHRAEHLARIAGVSVRTLHRAFERYIGVGPKWIIRRSRVQEAAERVATGAPVAWAALAQELGYHDQAHLIREFKAQVGFTPAVYAERCAAARSKGGPPGVKG